MVYTCILCKWRSDKHPQRSFHKLPSNNELKQKWLDILGKSNVTVGTRTALCSSHFEEDCYRYGIVYGRKLLKDGSLPTLHLTKSDTKDNAKMKDPASKFNKKKKLKQVSISELDMEKNPADVSMEIILPRGSSRKSDVQPKKPEMMHSQPKVLKLILSKKPLRRSQQPMKSQLTELKKITKYNAQNKSLHLTHEKVQCPSDASDSWIEDPEEKPPTTCRDLKELHVGLKYNECSGEIRGIKVEYDELELKPDPVDIDVHEESVVPQLTPLTVKQEPVQQIIEAPSSRWPVLTLCAQKTSDTENEKHKLQIYVESQPETPILETVIKLEQENSEDVIKTRVNESKSGTRAGKRKIQEPCITTRVSKVKVKLKSCQN